MIKCVGCYDLLREELDLGGKHLVVYICPDFFPYACALSGLLHPGSGITKAVKACAVKDCPEQLGAHCILCTKTDLVTYGLQDVFICKEHDRAWGKWLEEHPERRAYLAPKGRSRKSNWIEVFREFVEDMRKEAKKC